MAGKAAAENFPVALRLLPRRYRDHLMAVYRFARTVDDYGDEAPAGQRAGLLAGLSADLGALYGGQGTPSDPAVAGLAGVVSQCAVPAQPFRDLIAANQQDQVVHRYETFEDLLGYCQLSANPVGQLVLYVFGATTGARLRRSDAVCSALQVIEHLQDVGEDYANGRVYLPQADLRAFGCPEADLAAPAASAPLRAVVAALADRADGLLAEGAPLAGELHGWAKVAVSGYIAGGRAALAAIRAADCDVLSVACTPSKRGTVAALASTLVRGR